MSTSPSPTLSNVQAINLLALTKNASRQGIVRTSRCGAYPIKAALFAGDFSTTMPFIQRRVFDVGRGLLLTTDYGSDFSHGELFLRVQEHPFIIVTPCCLRLVLQAGFNTFPLESRLTPLVRGVILNRPTNFSHKPRSSLPATVCRSEYLQWP